MLYNSRSHYFDDFAVAVDVAVVNSIAAAEAVVAAVASVSFRLPFYVPPAAVVVASTAVCESEQWSAAKSYHYYY